MYKSDVIQGGRWPCWALPAVLWVLLLPLAPRQLQRDPASPGVPRGARGTPPAQAKARWLRGWGQSLLVATLGPHVQRRGGGAGREKLHISPRWRGQGTGWGGPGQGRFTTPSRKQERGGQWWQGMPQSGVWPWVTTAQPGTAPCRPQL